MAHVYEQIIRRLTKEEIANPKLVLKILFEHAKQKSEIKTKTLFGQKSSESQLLREKLSLALIANEEKCADPRDISAIIFILNHDPKISDLQPTSELMGLFSAYFSYFPEYLLQLRSYHFFKNLILDFGWVNYTVKHLIRLYIKQLDPRNEDLFTTACNALAAAAKVMPEEQIIQLIPVFLDFILDKHAVTIRTSAYKTLSHLTCFANDETKAEVFKILEEQAQTEFTFNHYSIFDAIMVLLPSLTGKLHVEASNLINCFQFNKSRSLRQAATKTLAKFQKDQELAESKPLLLEGSESDLSLEESEKIKFIAHKLHYAERVKVLREIALDNNESHLCLNFEVINSIFYLNEVQHSLQQMSSQTFIQPITCIINEYLQEPLSHHI